MRRSLKGPAALLLGALAVALPAFPAQAPAAEGVTFFSPWEGSHVAGGKAVVTLRTTPPRRTLTLILNGKPVGGVQTDGTAWWATITPAAGSNVLDVKDGAVLATLTFLSGAQDSGRPVYRYHEALLDGKCDRCHSGSTRRRPTTATADTCYGCHDPWEGPYIHGPVGAGECIFCHDPHGSTLPGMVRTTAKKQCQSCHDQSSSREHLEQGKNQDCNRCHDPHGAKNRLLLRN